MRNGLVVDDGVQRWYKDDKLHREDGPAVVWADGTQEWWREGKQHREDGPAVVWADGTQEWWREGERIECSGDAVSTELRSIAAQLVALAKKV